MWIYSNTIDVLKDVLYCIKLCNHWFRQYDEKTCLRSQNYHSVIRILSGNTHKKWFQYPQTYDEVQNFHFKMFSDARKNGNKIIQEQKDNAMLVGKGFIPKTRTLVYSSQRISTEKDTQQTIKVNMGHL